MRAKLVSIMEFKVDSEVDKDGANFNSLINKAAIRLNTLQV